MFTVMDDQYVTWKLHFMVCVDGPGYLMLISVDLMLSFWWVLPHCWTCMFGSFLLKHRNSLQPTIAKLDKFSFQSPRSSVVSVETLAQQDILGRPPYVVWRSEQLLYARRFPLLVWRRSMTQNASVKTWESERGREKWGGVALFNQTLDSLKRNPDYNRTVNITSLGMSASQ